MKLTLVEVGKKLKELKNNFSNLIEIESKSKEFVGAMGEDVESIRPIYDYSAVQKQLDDINNEIRRIKHLVNLANTTTVVAGFDKTIDEMLVYIPQLSARINKLSKMRGKLKRERVSDRYARSNIIEYNYINYDVNKVNEDYNRLVLELNRAQMALDKTNNSTIIEI